MTTLNAQDDALLEECIDELDAAIEPLARFPLIVLACSLRAHLAGLLRAMAEGSRLESPQIEEFLRELSADVLGEPSEDVFPQR